MLFPLKNDPCYRGEPFPSGRPAMIGVVLLDGQDARVVADAKGVAVIVHDEGRFEVQRQLADETLTRELADIIVDIKHLTLDKLTLLGLEPN